MKINQHLSCSLSIKPQTLKQILVKECPEKRYFTRSLIKVCIAPEEDLRCFLLCLLGKCLPVLPFFCKYICLSFCRLSVSAHFLLTCFAVTFPKGHTSVKTVLIHTSVIIVFHLGSDLSRRSYRYHDNFDSYQCDHCVDLGSDPSQRSYRCEKQP